MLSITRILIAAAAVYLATATQATRIEASEVTTSTQILAALTDAVELCLLTAIQPTKVNWYRSTGPANCKQAELMTAEFQQLANRTRNLDCSTRTNGLSNSILLISIHGGSTERALEASENLQGLKKACYHAEVTN